MATTGLAVPAGAPPLPTVLSATSWVVADLDTRCRCSAPAAPHEYGAPASLQKLLLAATVLPKLDPAQVVTVTAEDLDFEPGSSAVGLILGGQVHGARRCGSGCCSTPATTPPTCSPASAAARPGVAGTLRGDERRGRGGSAPSTRTPRPRPGWTAPASSPARTTWRSSPAPASPRRTSAATSRPTRRRRSHRQPPKDKRRVPDPERQPAATNYPGALGGKTGFTDVARHTFVGAAQRNGRRLVVTLLGAEHRPVRTWQQAAALLDWGFALPPDTSVGRLVTPGEAEDPFAKPSPEARPAAGVPSLGPSRFGAPWSMSGSWVAAVLFASAWLGILLASRRRRGE